MGDAFFALEMMGKDRVKKFIGMDVALHQGKNLAFFNQFHALFRHGIFLRGMDSSKRFFAGYGLEEIANNIFITD